MTDRLSYLLALAALAGVIALVACGLGASLRSTAGTITVLMTVLLVLPTFAGFLPSASWSEAVASVLPLTLPGQIATIPGSTGDLGVLSPVGASAVMVAYAVVSVGLGAFSFARRDS